MPRTTQSMPALINTGRIPGEEGSRKPHAVATLVRQVQNLWQLLAARIFEDGSQGDVRQRNDGLGKTFGGSCFRSARPSANMAERNIKLLFVVIIQVTMHPQLR